MVPMRFSLFQLLAVVTVSGLSLAALVQATPLAEQAYDRGRYDTLDDSQVLQPPLLAQEAAWIDEQLRAAGKR
jgi:hypothetical protein